MHYTKFFALALSLLLTASISSAQILVDEGTGSSSQNIKSNSENKNSSGEGAAQKYFEKRESSKPSVQSVSPGARYMAVQIGSFVNDNAYRWGANRKDEDVGEMILGVSYRIGEWINSADLLARIEYTQYDVDGETPKKLSFMPVISFPDARSGFPLYFGGGAGLGVFLKQVDDESSLSLDYNIHAGARFMNMFPSGGVLVETGLKGHFHLIGSGQFDGVYVSVGGAFTF